MDRINNFNRRDWLKLLTAGAAAACATHSAQAQAAQPVKTAARIVIAGAGAAGLAAASRLAQQLSGAQITLVDARKEHYYQPGFTLVGAGIKPADYVVSQTGSYVPSAGCSGCKSALPRSTPRATRWLRNRARCCRMTFNCRHRPAAAGIWPHRRHGAGPDW